MKLLMNIVYMYILREGRESLVDILIPTTLCYKGVNTLMLYCENRAPPLPSRDSRLFAVCRCMVV